MKEWISKSNKMMTLIFATQKFMRKVPWWKYEGHNFKNLRFFYFLVLFYVFSTRENSNIDIVFFWFEVTWWRYRAFCEISKTRIFIICYSFLMFSTLKNSNYEIFFICGHVAALGRILYNFLMLSTLNNSNFDIFLDLRSPLSNPSHHYEHPKTSLLFGKTKVKWNYLSEKIISSTFFQPFELYFHSLAPGCHLVAQRRFSLKSRGSNWLWLKFWWHSEKNFRPLFSRFF